MPLIV